MNKCPVCIKTRDRINDALKTLISAVRDSIDADNDVDVITRVDESPTEAASSAPRVEIVREPSTDEGTFGVLLIDGKQFCYTCELPWRNNARNVSCIPTGTYQCEMINRSSNGQPAYWIKNVPGRTGIVIHSGNTISDSNGCPLLGMTRGKLGGREAVLQSRDAIAKFHAELAQKTFTLTIKEA